MRAAGDACVAPTEADATARAMRPIVLRVAQRDERPRAALREQFEEQRVVLVAVEDVDALHAALQRLGARLDLRDHPAGDLPGLDEPVDLLRRDRADERLRVLLVAED